MSNQETLQTPAEFRYSCYTLVVLTIVYVVNFIDRQILAILNEEIKRDLHLSDAQMGFLYGTVFAVFYALFGIPFGRKHTIFACGSVAISTSSSGRVIWSNRRGLFAGIFTLSPGRLLNEALFPNKPWLGLVVIALGALLILRQIRRDIRPSKN